MEYSFKHSHIVARGDFPVFVARPIAATCLTALAVPSFPPLPPRLGKESPGAATMPDEV